jgi:hypothetical protein
MHREVQAVFMRTLQILLLVAGVFLCSAPARAQGAAAAIRETAVKAAFLSKFAGFVEWPAGMLSQPEEPLVIGVIGNDEVAADLQQIAAVRTGELRPIVVRKLPPDAGGSGLHVMFVGAAREARVRDVMAQARGPVLVVTEQEEGLRLGSVLNFSVDDGRVRFAASTAAAEARGLRLSARLLALAQSVDGRSR